MVLARLKVIDEGKTKIIFLDPYNGNQVFIRNKPVITAGDGEKRDFFEQKDVFSTQTAANIFRLLNARGIQTHYLGLIDERTFLARKARMIPIELVARRIAYGSYLKRNPDEKKGNRFSHPVIEFFLKDDVNHDPLMVWNQWDGEAAFFLYDSKKPLQEGKLGKLKKEDLPDEWNLIPEDLAGVDRLITITAKTFLAVEEAWAKQEVVLVDLKIECGYDEETGKLLVADVIDNDSWRIWPGGDNKQMKDKQVYRDQGMTDSLKENYAWVAEATSRFL